MLPHWKRNRALGAAALLVLIGAALAFYFFRQGGPYDAKRLISSLPPREAAIAYIDFRALRDSGVLDLIVGKAADEEAEYRKFVEQTGFNYKEDLHSVTMSSAGGLHYFVVEGRFDWDKLRAFANNSGGNCKGDACWTKGSTPDRVISFRPLGRGLMALASGRDESAVHAIARRDYATGTDVPPEPLWIRMPGSMLRSPSGLPPGTALFAQALSTAEYAIFMLGPEGEAYELALDVTCKSAEEAAVMRTQLSEVTTLLQKLISREGQKPNPHDLSGVLTAGVFTRDGNHVIGRWPISPTLLQALAKGS